MNNLKPCPFCGGNPQLQHDDIDNSYTIECTNNECNMNPSTPYCDTEEGAIEYWNDRVDNHDNIGKQIKPCPFCGEAPLTEIGLARYGMLGDCVAIKIVCAECHVVKSIYIRDGTDFNAVREAMDKIVERWNIRKFSDDKLTI